MEKLFIIRRHWLVHGNHIYRAPFPAAERPHADRKHISLDVSDLWLRNVFSAALEAHKKMAYRRKRAYLCHSYFYRRIFQRAVPFEKKFLSVGLWTFKMECLPRNPT